MEVVLIIVGGGIGLLLLIFFINSTLTHNKRMKTRVVEKAKRIASLLGIDILNVPQGDDVLKSNLRFTFRKKISEVADLYIREESIKANKRADSDLYHHFYNYSIHTAETEHGIFIYSKRGDYKYNWEEKGYAPYNESKTLNEKFVIYTRNLNPKLSNILQRADFTQLLLSNENAFLRPFTFNFEKYQLQLSIQEGHNMNPKYSMLFQPGKASEEDAHFKANQIGEGIKLVTALFDFLQ